MKLRDFQIFTDQNIHADVTAFLRNMGCDVLDVNESGWTGESDHVLFHRAATMQRVVLTHDGDSSQLAFHDTLAFTGIVHLRPGHMLPIFTIESLQELFVHDPDLEPGFLIVVTRQSLGIKIRTIQVF